MAWYWIVLIIIVCLFALLFLVYMTNADMKMVEILYNKIIAYHDKKEQDEKF
ncbi:MAG: hypothetical protein R3Y24_07635 [Eubacteriales bacterium]